MMHWEPGSMRRATASDVSLGFHKYARETRTKLFSLEEGLWASFHPINVFTRSQIQETRDDPSYDAVLSTQHLYVLPLPHLLRWNHPFSGVGLVVDGDLQINLHLSSHAVMVPLTSRLRPSVQVGTEASLLLLCVESVEGPVGRRGLRRW